MWAGNLRRKRADPGLDRALQIIGEAAARLDPELVGSSTAPWAGIVGMRNILVHRYFGIDLDAVWQVVERDLGPLDAEVRRLLDVVPSET